MDDEFLVDNELLDHDADPDQGVSVLAIEVE